MKIKVTAFSFLIIYSVAISQTKKLDSLINYGYIKESIFEIQDLIKKEGISKEFAYMYAEVLAIDNKIDSSFYYLNIAIREDSTYNFIVNPKLINLINDKKWQDLVEHQLEKYQARKGKFMDYEYAKELLALKQKDQQYYYEINISKKTNGFESPVTNALWTLKDKINADNLTKLETLISEKGYPKCSENMPCAIPFLIIQHSNLEVQEKYIKLIEQLCNNKDIPCNHYAMLFDRIQLRKNKPQLYGTQFIYDKDGNSIKYEIFKPKELNERREKLGLNPISIK